MKDVEKWGGVLQKIGDKIWPVLKSLRKEKKETRTIWTKRILFKKRTNDDKIRLD